MSAFKTKNDSGCSKHLDRDFCNCLSDYNPNYAVHPSETLEELCLYKVFGETWARRIQDEGIDPKEAYLYEAMFGIDRSFFINLQKNYLKTLKRLNKKVT